MRIRTVWTWRLRVYPLIVAGLYVYVATAGSIPETEASLRSSTEASGGQSVAAPLSGFHKGRAITCHRHPLVTLCYRLTEERG